MEPAARKKFEAARNAPVSLLPPAVKKPLICFQDRVTTDLGADPTGNCFELISESMLRGHYYPPDAVQCFAEAMDEKRPFHPGDRILQRAPILPFWPVFAAWSMVEVILAEKTPDRCRFGYITTKAHHGKGTWQAELKRENGRLILTVSGRASPQSWLFWLGLPIARYLQKRAWRRAVEEFVKIVRMGCG